MRSVFLNKFGFGAVCVCLFTGAISGQFGRGGGDWATPGGDAQRSAWVKTDPKISPESMQKPGFAFLWKLKLGRGSVTPAVLLDRYIGYRGFRSLGFVGAGDNSVYGIDTDLAKIEWQKQLQGAGGIAKVARPTVAAYPGGAPTRGGGMGRGGPAKSATGKADEGAALLAELTARAPDPGFPRPAGGGPQRRLPSFLHVLSGDGMFHSLYVSNGEEPEPPVRFLPANADAQGFIVADEIAYAVVGNSKVLALDMASKQVADWTAPGRIAGSVGAALGPDGSLYIASESGDFHALEAKSLRPKGHVSAPQGFRSAPVIFDFKGKNLIAVATRDGGLQLVDGGSVSSAAHAPGAAADTTSTNLASWTDTAGTRWILAPVNSTITAWKVVENAGAPALEPGWVARDIPSPQAPMVINGVVFVASANPAVLHALNGTTGSHLWNSGKAITGPVRGAALSAAGSQIYVGAEDGTLYAFGYPIEH